MTALVIEHSLRIRVTAETQPDQTPSPPPSASESSIMNAVAITSAAIEREMATQNESAADSTMSTTTESDISPSKGACAPPDGTKSSHSAEPEKSKEKHNLVGRVNNLVTSDLANISSGARDIFRICKRLIYGGLIEC